MLSTMPALLYHGDSGIVEQLPADAIQFVFSPNGRWPAIWITAEYTLHDAAAWSPDGRFLLFSGTHKESGEDGLFMMVLNHQTKYLAPAASR